MKSFNEIKINNFKDYLKIVTPLTLSFFTSIDYIMRQREKEEINNIKKRYLVTAKISEPSRF